ncbi:MAG: ribonuclease Z [Saprospiraceae bacterium]|nr:ribonuclease Z [Saprospiraceae bacterium]
MNYSVKLLGTSSAMPSRGRFPSSQFIQLSDWCGLIDCGEGAQIQMNNFHIKRNKIKHIFISHLHGDHVFGLPGLLGSYNHFNRKDPLIIYGPSGIKKMIDTIAEVSGAHYNYQLEIIELDHSQAGCIAISDKISIIHFPLKHRIPTIGYRFNYNEESINIRKSSIEEYGLSIEEIKSIKSGNNLIRHDGEKITWKAVADIKVISKSYAYCSDTIYDLTIIPHIQSVDYLYHETTYLDGMELEAADRMHATLGQAADIAVKAGVGALITGHYSSRYANLKVFGEAAKELPLNVILGREGLQIDL